MGMHTIFNLTQRLRVAGAVLMVSSLGLFCPGNVSNVHAQSPTKAMPTSPSGGPKEGIKVHGNWTIYIRNADGTLVSHHEFKNALTISGGALLGRFLQRTHKPGEWVISLASEVAHLNPCEVNIAGPMPCGIYESTTQLSTSEASGQFNTLTISSEGGPNTNRTVLAGSAKARKNGVIDNVATLLINSCPVDSQGVCNGSGAGNELFTRTTLATPINVVAGQIIQVKMVISFS